MIPPSLRKSGIPHETEIPAPVMTMMRLDWRIKAAALCIDIDIGAQRGGGGNGEARGWGGG